MSHQMYNVSCIIAIDDTIDFTRNGNFKSLFNPHDPSGYARLKSFMQAIFFEDLTIEHLAPANCEFHLLDLPYRGRQDVLTMVNGASFVGCEMQGKIGSKDFNRFAGYRAANLILHNKDSPNNVSSYHIVVVKDPTTMLPPEFLVKQTKRTYIRQHSAKVVYSHVNELPGPGPDASDFTYFVQLSYWEQAAFVNPVLYQWMYILNHSRVDMKNLAYLKNGDEKRIFLDVETYIKQATDHQKFCFMDKVTPFMSSEIIPPLLANMKERKEIATKMIGPTKKNLQNNLTKLQTEWGTLVGSFKEIMGNALVESDEKSPSLPVVVSSVNDSPLNPDTVHFVDTSKKKIYFDLNLDELKKMKNHEDITGKESIDISQMKEDEIVVLLDCIVRCERYLNILETCKETTKINKSQLEQYRLTCSGAMAEFKKSPSINTVQVTEDGLAKTYGEIDAMPSEKNVSFGSTNSELVKALAQPHGSAPSASLVTSPGAVPSPTPSSASDSSVDETLELLKEQIEKTERLAEEQGKVLKEARAKLMLKKSKRRQKSQKIDPVQLSNRSKATDTSDFSPQKRKLDGQSEDGPPPKVHVGAHESRTAEEQQPGEERDIMECETKPPPANDDRSLQQTVDPDEQLLATSLQLSSTELMRMFDHHPETKQAVLRALRKK